MSSRKRDHKDSLGRKQFRGGSCCCKCASYSASRGTYRVHRKPRGRRWPSPSAKHQTADHSRADRLILARPQRQEKWRNSPVTLNREEPQACPPTEEVNSLGPLFSFLGLTLAGMHSKPSWICAFCPRHSRPSDASHASRQRLAQACAPVVPLNSAVSSIRLRHYERQGSPREEALANESPNAAPRKARLFCFFQHRLHPHGHTNNSFHHTPKGRRTHHATCL